MIKIDHTLYKMLIDLHEKADTQIRMMEILMNALTENEETTEQEETTKKPRITPKTTEE